MPISAQIRSNWVATQKKFDYPVNAIGVKIGPNDKKTMQVWVAERIDEDGRLAIDSSMSYRGVPVPEAPPKAAASAAPAADTGKKPVLTYRGVPIE